MQVQPYLYFDGHCQEAIDFYRQALGAEVLMQMPFKASPIPASVPEDAGDKIMHACVRIGETNIFMSDGRCTGNPSFRGFALSIAAHDDQEARRLFTAIQDGGTVTMALTETFFASSFGMATDRFGVAWMVIRQKPALTPAA